MTIKTLFNQHNEIMNKIKITSHLLNDLDTSYLALGLIDEVLQQQITLTTHSAQSSYSDQGREYINNFFSENNAKINDMPKYYISLDRKLFDGNFEINYKWGNFSLPKISTQLYNLQNTNISNQKSAKNALALTQEAANINSAIISKINAYQNVINEFLDNLTCYEHVLSYFLKNTMLEEKLDFNLQICDTVSVHNILSKEFDLTSKANSPIYNENQRSLFDFSYQKLEDALQAIYQENPTIFSIECPIKDDQIFYIESECIHLKHDLLTAQNTKVTHDYILSELAKTDSMITTLLGDPRAKSEIWGN